MRYLSFQFFFFSIIILSAYLNEAEEEAALTVGSGFRLLRWSIEVEVEGIHTSSSLHFTSLHF
jgi:hypothetical protein